MNKSNSSYKGNDTTYGMNKEYLHKSEIRTLINQYEFYIDNLNRCVTTQKRDNPKDVIGIEIWETNVRVYNRVIEDLKRLQN